MVLTRSSQIGDRVAAVVPDRQAQGDWIERSGIGRGPVAAFPGVAIAFEIDSQQFSVPAADQAKELEVRCIGRCGLKPGFSRGIECLLAELAWVGEAAGEAERDGD